MSPITAPRSPARPARTLLLGLMLLALAAACSRSDSDPMAKGKDFLAKGEVPSAVIEFKNAVQAKPQSAAARLALGEGLEHAGDLAGAEQQYQRALEFGGDANDLVPRIAILMLDRNDPAALMRSFGSRKLSTVQADSDLRATLALAQLSNGKPAEALATLAEANANTPAVRLARAQIALSGGHQQEAADELNAALKDGKAPWWALRAASRAYAGIGDQVRANQALEAAYRAAPWNQGLIGEYAERLISTGRSAEARPLRDKLKKIAPSYYRTSYVDALLLLQDGKPEDAYPLLLRVLASLPAHQPSQLIAASIELQRGQLGSADAKIGKVLQANPNSLEALNLRAAIAMRQGKRKVAEDAIKRGLALAPNDARFLAASADFAWAKGDKAGALKQMEGAATQSPPRPQMLLRLAEMKLAAGQKDSAIDILGQAARLADKDPRTTEQILHTALDMRLFDSARKIAQAQISARPKDPEPLIWMAAVLGMEGNVVGALEQANQALDLKADYYPALLAVGKSASTPEALARYEARLQKAMDSGTKDARIYFDRVRQLQARGATQEQVAEALGKGLAAAPASIDLRQAVIVTWLQKGNKDKALALANEGEALLRNDARMLALAASVYEQTGAPEQAISRHARLSELFPNRPDEAVRYAEILARNKQKAQAMAHLKKFIANHPDEAQPYLVLASMQGSEGRSDDALVTAALMKQRPSLEAPGLLLEGDVQARLGRKPEALAAYARADKEGAHEAALLRRISVLDGTGQPEVADAELAKWLNLHPDSVQALSLAARRASLKGDYPGAARHLEAIVKQDPANSIALNDLAWAYTQARDARGLETAEKAAKLSGDNPNVLDTLALAQSAAGRKDQAETTLRRALALDSKNVPVRVHLAELLHAKGQDKDTNELLAGVDTKQLDRETSIRYKALTSHK